MNNIKMPSLKILAGLIAIVILVYVFAVKKPANAPAPTGTTPITEETTPTAGTPAKTAAPKPATTKTTATSQSAIKLLTPAAGDAWAINSIHIINWTKEAGTIGSIQLIKSNGDVAGFILSNTGANQSSLNWETRDVSVNRLGGTKNNLEPGSYKVRIVFDQKYSPIESGQFTVLPAGSTSETVTNVVRIKGEKITPSPLTVAKGAKVIFLNNDTRTHTITSTSFTGFSMASNVSYTFDTSNLSPNTYYYYSNIYSYLAPGTLIIK